MKRERAQSRTEIGDGRAAVNSVAAVSSAEVDILGQFISTSPQTTQTKKKQKRSPIRPTTKFKIATTESTKNTSAMDVDESASETLKSDVVSSGDGKTLENEEWTKVEKRKAKKVKKVEQRAEVFLPYFARLAFSHFFPYSNQQELPPRLLYAPSEIARKRSGVEISVCSPNCNDGKC